MKLQAPKGTRDFYPEDMHVQNHIFSVWRKTAALFCFEEFEGPVFEHLEVFTRKSGDEIVEQLYHFQDKAGRDLALRPEITPTLARMVAQKGSALKKPVKWFSIPRLFRYERTQKGREREFFQLNLDILGEPSVSADAEIVAAAACMLGAFGLTAEDVRIKVSSRRLVRALLLEAGIAENALDAAYAVMDRRGKMDPQALLAAYKDKGIGPGELERINTVFDLQTLDNIKAGSKSGETAEAAAELDGFFARMGQYGIRDLVDFDLSIVRGLAYYTGVVFEIFDARKALRAVAGGGRYDHLVSLFGGENLPATGFGVGDAVLAELLAEKKSIPAYRRAVQAYIVNFNRNDAGPALKTAALLRGQGVSAEFSLRPQSVQKQMDTARHAAYTVFVGGDEWAEGKVKVRDMAQGSETRMDYTALAGLFRKKG